MRIAFGVFTKRNRYSWFCIGPNGGWKFFRYATNGESAEFGPGVANLADEDVVGCYPYFIYTPITMELDSS